MCTMVVVVVVVVVVLLLLVLLLLLELQCGCERDVGRKLRWCLVLLFVCCRRQASLGRC